ncbi:unnamed protein product [Dibothriocephalus latus]|uniref:Cation/H+ exchanger transmembrane domain-containing protein n=1 Tax=Dibothriocephalus latus TaxID=60516 RepID=A0A3P7QN14_DIBLA|nr:unnamed protein product [Dibothriocephalus latus]
MKISLKEQVILIYGGLRGAVAFSLAILIDYNHLGHDGEDIRKIIITATLFIILVTVGFMGLTMKPLVRLFKIKLAGDKNLSLFGDLNDALLDHTLAGVEAIIGSHGRNRAREFFSRLDDKYFPSDLNLQEFFLRHSASASSLPSRDSEEQQKQQEEQEHRHRHHHRDRHRSVHFDEDAGEDQPKSVDPHWRRRTSLLNEGRDIEDFQDSFRDVMKAKTRVLKQRRRRPNRTSMDLETRLNTMANQRIPTRERLSKSTGTETAEQDEQNRDTVEYENDSDESGDAIVIPKKDYPREKGSSSTIDFHLGDDEQ